MADEPTPPVTIDIDRYCVRCGYLLRGLPMTGACPECGTEVAVSLQNPTLASVSPEYLRTLRLGLIPMLIGTAGSAAVMLGWAIVAWQNLSVDVPALVSRYVSAFNTLSFLGGIWLYSAPNPADVHHETRRSSRRFLRVVTASYFVMHLVSWILFVVRNLSGTPRLGSSAFWTVWSGLSSVLWVVQIFFLLRYTRSIARKVPDPRAVIYANVYQWLIPACLGTGNVLAPMLGFGFGIGFYTIALPIMWIALTALYWSLLLRTLRHILSFIRTGHRADLAGLDRPMPLAQISPAKNPSP